MADPTDRQMRAKAVALVSEIDEAELAVRLIESAGGFKAPPGIPAKHVLNLMDDDARVTSLRMARAAMLYWRERIQKALVLS